MLFRSPGGGRAGHILVDVGPGSFTGIRVGIAAARGLALGWGATVSGYSSLTLLAAAGLAARPDLGLLAVVLEAGHGEVFMQPFAARPLTSLTDLASLRPEAALAALDGRLALGNGVRFLTALAPDLVVAEALPRATDSLLLPVAMTALAPSPLYGRAPDAKPLAVS